MMALCCMCDGILLEFHEVFVHGDRDDNIMSCVSLYIPLKASLRLTCGNGNLQSPGEAQYYNAARSSSRHDTACVCACVIK
jgi:hypothetical protein